MDQPSVFISYSHRDAPWKNRLVKHLRVLARAQGFEVWHDGQIGAGDAWRAHIETALTTARVAVLLVSVDWLESPFVNEEELPLLLERRAQGRLHIVPVIVKDCPWKDVAALSGIQVRPEGGRALERLPKNEINAALVTIAAEIASLVARPPVLTAGSPGEARPRAEAMPAGVTPPAPAPTAAGQPAPEPTAPEPTAPAPPQPDLPAPQRPLQRPAADASALPSLVPPVPARSPQPLVAPHVPASAPPARTVENPPPAAPVAAPSPARPAVKPSVTRPSPLRRALAVAGRGLPIWLIALAVVAVGTYLLGRKPRVEEGSLDQASTASPTPLAFGTVAFTTVTVDERGAIIARRESRANAFHEDLAAGVSLTMVAIPGGTFTMGSPKDEEGRADSEGPQRQVRLEPFFMARTEVTQAQWRAVAAWPQVKRSLAADPAHFKGEDRPVESVSWHDAVEFCARLSARTGRAYRLPSEAEWEYAARAGTTTPFHFGPTITPELVNYNGNYPYGQAAKGASRSQTTPVGTLGGANAFGLFDVHGNVWEWVQDAWHAGYDGAPVDGQAWEQAGDTTRRVVRGGSWGIGARNCRSAYRGDVDTDYWNLNVGFRVLCSVARTP